MSLRGLRDSLSARAVAALAVVLTGYLVLHASFAAVDTTLVGHVLAILGFEVSRPEPERLVVQSGDAYDVYAVVTGACSSAAGALGIVAAALVLLPGPLGRRALGAALGVTLFVTLNVVRIVGILSLGWVFAVVPHRALLTGLGLALAVAALGALCLRRFLVVRCALVLAAVVLGVLAYDVVRGYDYAVAIATYHALAGPMLTFSALALALLVLWRTIVGPRAAPQRG